MTGRAPADLAAQLASGLLSFPVTPFDADLEIDEAQYAAHIEWQASYPVAALFAAGGTGEGFSLTTPEIDRVVRIAVDVAGDRLPIIAPATGSLARAVEEARRAEDAGAAGILLFPPYLTECDQEGLLERASRVCAATGLGVVVYNRANAVLRADAVRALADRHPNFVALKDGIGDIEALARITTALGERLTYIGGLPTAETFALPLAQLGMTTYSSAIYNFLPEWALEFHAAVRSQDRATVSAMLGSFVLPYIDIRDRTRGNAVSIVKAGLTAVGRHGGPVRPPLQDLNPADQVELEALVAAARAGGAR